jgi:hypothetical protein
LYSSIAFGLDMAGSVCASLPTRLAARDAWSSGALSIARDPGLCSGQVGSELAADSVCSLSPFLTGRGLG